MADDATTVDNVMNDINDIALGWYSTLNPSPPPTVQQTVAQPTTITLGSASSPVLSASAPTIGIVFIGIAVVALVILFRK